MRRARGGRPDVPVVEPSDGPFVDVASLPLCRLMGSWISSREVGRVLVALIASSTISSSSCTSIESLTGDCCLWRFEGGTWAAMLESRLLLVVPGRLDVSSREGLRVAGVVFVGTRRRTGWAGMEALSELLSEPLSSSSGRWARALRLVVATMATGEYCAAKSRGIVQPSSKALMGFHGALGMWTQTASRLAIEAALVWLAGGQSIWSPVPMCISGLGDPQPRGRLPCNAPVSGNIALLWNLQNAIPTLI